MKHKLKAAVSVAVVLRMGPATTQEFCANIESKAKLAAASLGTVKIDPMVYGVHIGYRF